LLFDVGLTSLFQKVWHDVVLMMHAACMIVEASCYAQKANTRTKQAHYLPSVNLQPLDIPG
jgi:hypothetical protein